MKATFIHSDNSLSLSTAVTMFSLGHLRTTGTEIEKILPAGSRFDSGPNSRLNRKTRVVKWLEDFFDRFHILG